MNLRELKLNKSFYSIIPLKKLKEEYEILCRELNKNETSRTSAEFIFNKFLDKESKIKFEHSMWIGKRNIDFFTPSLKGKNNFIFYGVAFEIDGSIHNQEFKMGLDNSKQPMMNSLNILLKHVDNYDHKKESFKNDWKNLLKYPRTTTRERRRIYRNIYIYTILKNLEDAEIVKRFGETGAELLKKIGQTL